MDYTKYPPVILSLCPGMLGLERGFDRACERLGWLSHTTAAYVEIESFIIWNLAKQMEQGVLAPAPIWSNVKTFPWDRFRGKIHGFIGGYPCQPFSLAGKQNGAEDPRHLWPHIAEGIRAIRPVWCFFENVRNHLNIGYETVRAELQEMGYRVREGIYSAEEVGAPHRRERLFILAILGDANSDDNNSKRKHVAEMFGLSQQERTDQGLQKSGLANIGELSTQETEGLDNRFKFSSNELDHSMRGRYGRSEEEIRTGRNTSLLASEIELANSRQSRLAGWEKQPTREEFKALKRSGRENRWPARPGEAQYSWEEPRTIEKESFKSCVGGSTSRYNFREDLLRMAGNGVVEQTAEIAFIDLLNKHL